jgi:hypothetical protein
MLGNSCVGAQLAASQEGLSSKKLVNQCLFIYLFTSGLLLHRQHYLIYGFYHAVNVNYCLFNDVDTRTVYPRTLPVFITIYIT